MNLLRSYGRVIYGITTLAASVCGLLISMALLVGFAYSGVMGDAPGDPGYQRYTLAALTGFFGTAILFVGLIGAWSQLRVFPVFTIVGTVLLLFLLVPFAAHGVRGTPLLWVLFIVFFEVAALSLAILKLRQLRTASATVLP